MAEGPFLTLDVRVQPRAGRRKLWVDAEGRFRAALQSPPEGGKANRELVRLVAKALGTAGSNVEVCKGLKSRDKALRLYRVDSTQVELLVRRLREKG